MTEQLIACDIKAIKAEERERHFALGAQWQNAIEQVVELPSGYAFRLSPESVNLINLAEFVSGERLCCPFFHFEIALEANDGPLWLRLLGGGEVKSVVRESFLAQQS